MNAKEFLKQHGKQEVEKVCKQAKTSYAYFTQLASGNRRPSPELAARLVEASGGRLDFKTMLLTAKPNPSRVKRPYRRKQPQQPWAVPSHSINE